MGEFRVHHVRFYEWTPQAIQCMAYNKEKNKLALSRSDGSIELWNLKDDWFQEEVIPGTEGQSIEALVWQGDRLFSAGLDGNINEIDLVTLLIKVRCPSNAGPVWCLASNPASTKLVAGTEEGCLVLLDTEHGALEYSSRFDSQESRILCVDWHPSEPVVVTGGIDNIRMWSVASGRAMQRLTLARQDKNKETVVWCVALLSDMTIISGDSRGKTTFWNGKQGTVIKSLQSHKADVFCLAVDDTETFVVSSGVDSSVVQFNYIAARENSDWRDWVGTFLHNQHTHDVRAMTVIGKSVVTGGVDTNIIMFDVKAPDVKKVKNRLNNRWKRIPPIPQRPLVHVAGLANILLLRYSHSLEVWRLGHTDHTGVNGDILKLRSSPLKLISLKTKSGAPVFCCDITQNASLLAYSDGESIRAYRISIDNVTSIQPGVNMSRVPACKKSPPGGAHCLHFLSHSERLVAVTTTSRLQICTVTADDKLAVGHTFPEQSDSYYMLRVSADDKYAAVADHSCNVHIYDLENLQHVCNVPQTTSQISSMAFSADGQHLVMAYTNQKILEFSVACGEYSSWTKTVMGRFMRTWLQRKSKITNITYNPSNADQIILHDEQMFCILDKSQAFPPDNIKWQDLCRPSPDKSSAFHVCTKYKFLLHLEALADKWLVAVERPPLDLFSSLPEALKRKKYGT